MNFTWDIVLNAKRHGTEEQDLFFRPAKECSPWYEQSFPILNETRAEGPEIDWAVLKKITGRILAEVPGVCRVLYDLTPKPVGTIEWE